MFAGPAQSGKSNLPHALRSGVEALSGISLENVNVHYNSARPAQLNALAFAQGSDIHLAPGQERHLPHEAWHVAQQAQGRVRSTMQLQRGLPVNDDPALEREADVMGQRALQRVSRHQSGLSQIKPAESSKASGTTVVQRVFSPEQLRQIADLTFRQRVRLLSRVSEEDLRSYLDSEYHDINYLAGEESDEIRERRAKRAARSTADVDELADLLSGLSLEDRKDNPEDVVMAEPQVEIERNRFDADGDVVMEGVSGTVDGEMTDVHGRMDVEMEDVDGSVAMEIERVHGDVTIHMSDIHGEVRLTLMDLEARDSSGEKSPFGQMDIDITDVSGVLVIEIYPGSEPMQLEFGPVDAGETQRQRIDRRKRKQGPGKPEGTGKRQRTGDRAREEEEPESGLDFEIEELAEHFSFLSVSFHSDIDGKEHHLYPAREMEDVIVESNPVPLDAIIKAKLWLGVVIVAGVLNALNVLQQDAGKALTAFAKQRTKTAGNILRKALRAIAKELRSLSKNVDLPATDLSGSTAYPSNAPPTEGQRVLADPLSLNSKSTGHKPNDGRLMTAIRKLAGAESKSYKQMHLLNDNVFGPGELWNLTPGPALSNVRMEKDVEHHLKNAVISKGLVIAFEAKANYKHDPVGATQKDIDQNPDKFKFDSITFKASEYEFKSATNKWSNTNTAKDPDVKAINGAKIPWQYGNLTKLRPKPRILDPATTVKDLVDAGIPQATAKRISAFVVAKGTVVLTGKDKKNSLAEAVKAFDNKKKFTTDWDGRAVLWT
ncbi:MAG TPA: DUF4157 domain-containing protein [Bryobacteraceae bacterium]|jgi:hypothetical protein|nr:DUF4157 domain-containing protein [Bryobacteraceae bacterium]